MGNDTADRNGWETEHDLHGCRIEAAALTKRDERAAFHMRTDGRMGRAACSPQYSQFGRRPSITTEWCYAAVLFCIYITFEARAGRVSV
jgi:hypothetical protein